jgi:hypothetical protein
MYAGRTADDAYCAGSADRERACHLISCEQLTFERQKLGKWEVGEWTPVSR